MPMKITKRTAMSNSIAMPRCRGSASCMPSGRTIVGSGRLRRLRRLRRLLAVAVLGAARVSSFGGGGASSLRQPVSCGSVPARGPASSSSTSSTSPSAGTVELRVVALALERVGQHVPRRRARARPRRGSPAAASRRRPSSRVRPRGRRPAGGARRGSRRGMRRARPRAPRSSCRSCLEAFPQLVEQAVDRDPLLRHRVAVADGDRPIVEGVEVDGHAQRRARPRPVDGSGARWSPPRRRRSSAPAGAAAATSSATGTSRSFFDSGSTATLIGARRGCRRSTVRFSVPPLPLSTSSSS